MTANGLQNYETEEEDCKMKIFLYLCDTMATILSNSWAMETIAA